MMQSPLPNAAIEFMSWSWGQIEPYYRELANRQLNPHTLQAWLSDWSNLSKMLHEMFWRLNVAVTLNTTDQEAERRYVAFLDEIHPPSQAAEQELKEKLLASSLSPTGFEIPLRNMQTEANLFREENLPLLSEELKLGSE